MNEPTDHHRITRTLTPLVHKGAAYLDATTPKWETAIDLDNLDMQTCGACIVGQLRRSSLPIRGALVEDRDFDANYGFDLPGDWYADAGVKTTHENRKLAWSTLAELWYHEVAARVS